jgi:hypothetical protein
MKCSICFDPFDYDARKPLTLDECGHCYCQHCINNFTEKKCPECRKLFNKAITNYGLLNHLSNQTQEVSEFKQAISNFMNLEKDHNAFSKLIASNKHVNNKLFSKMIQQINEWETKEQNKIKAETQKKIEEIKKDEKKQLDRLFFNKVKLMNDYNSFKKKSNDFGNISNEINSLKSMLFDRNTHVDKSAKELNDATKQKHAILKSKLDSIKQANYYHFYVDEVEARILNTKMDLKKLQKLLGIDEKDDINYRESSKLSFIF